MKSFFNWLVILGFFVLPLQTSLAGKKTQKEVVEDAFRAWEEGVGSPFSLLAADATWTIMGPTLSAGTYAIEELEEQIIKPFNARLAGPLIPKLKAIFQDGDTVIILFDGQAPVINGDVYKNSYAWFFKMRDNQIREVVAVLDLNAYDRLMALPLERN